MDEIMKTMAASASGMAAQAARLRLSSENIANADTPGYRRKTVSFEEAFTTSDVRAVRTGPVRLDRAELVKVYDPTNPLAGPDGELRGLERQPRAGDRRRPRGEPLVRGQPPHVRPGAGDGELAHRPPAPLTGTG